MSILHVFGCVRKQARVNPRSARRSVSKFLDHALLSHAAGVLQKYDAAYGDLDFAAKAGADNL